MTINQKFTGRLALFSAALIWGTSFVILKNTLESISTLYVLAIRFTGAAMLMLIAGRGELTRHGGFAALRELGYIKGGAIMGVFLFAAYVLQTYGLLHTTPGKNAFLTSSYCVMTPFLHWVLSKKPPDKRNIAAAFICVVGMGLVSLHDDLSVGIGELLTIACGLFFALHILATSRFVEQRSLSLLNAVQFATAALLSWVLAVSSESFPAWAPVSAWLSILYLCVMCTAVCFSLQSYGQKYTPESTVAVIMTLESVFGTLISVIFYGEKLQLKTILGFVFIFVAVLVSETSGS